MQNPSSQPENEVDIIAADIQAQRQKVGSCYSWFLGIAGCTLINAVLGIAHAGIEFPIGVYMAQLPLMLVSKEAAVPAILISSVVFGAIFGLIARGAKFFKIWAMVIGFILYALDSVIPALCQSWMGLALHVWALWAIAGGIMACWRLQKLRPKS